MHRSHRSLRFSCIQICILRIRKCISCVCQYRLIAFCARHSASTKNATNLRADVSETDPTTKPAACVKWATSTSTPKSDADACRRRRRCRCRCWRCCSHFALNSTSKRNLFSPVHKHKLTLAHTLSLHTQSHTHARWRTHARWELVARILSFVYALELFIYVCKYTLFGCVCMLECVSFFWPVCFVLFDPSLPHLLSLNLCLSLSFWLIKWLSNGEWVCWVACRLSAGQLSAALECCCYTRNISMSFTICLVYCRSSFRFLVFGFLVSFSFVAFVFIFVFVFFLLLAFAFVR